MRERCAAIAKEEAILREGGGKAGQDRQHKMGRLPARERISQLLDQRFAFFRNRTLGRLQNVRAVGQQFPPPAPSRASAMSPVFPCMIIANDATVKAGAFFPPPSRNCSAPNGSPSNARLPLVYLVDSAGVFLPMQDEIFPDEDDFGRIFRNNSVISAAGIPQFAAIMGNCVAGGAYLPVLCDKILMTEGSGLYLAGPSLVKAAIGQIVDAEELGRREDARRDQRHG